MTGARPRRIRILRRELITTAARMLLVPYGIALGLMVWLPAPEASSVTGVVFEVARLVSDGTGIAMGTSYAVLEFIANVALFAPLGLLLSCALPDLNRWAIMLSGLATSCMIELVQLLLPTRVSTMSDVIANTLGAAIGCLAVRRSAHR